MSDQNLSTGGTIPLEEAIELTTNWRDFIGPIAGSGYVRAFYIPIDDIVNLATYHSAEGVRGYICLGTPNDPTTIKMVIVPIDESGKDIIYNQEEESAIYDFTQPCPALCDFTSPLYGTE